MVRCRRKRKIKLEKAVTVPWLKSRPELESANMQQPAKNSWLAKMLKGGRVGMTTTEGLLVYLVIHFFCFSVGWSTQKIVCIFEWKFWNGMTWCNELVIRFLGFSATILIQEIYLCVAVSSTSAVYWQSPDGDLRKFKLSECFLVNL